MLTPIELNCIMLDCKQNFMFVTIDKIYIFIL